MSEHLPFVVRVELSSSVIVGQRLTLDGILASLLFERTGDIDVAHNDLPLSRHKGVWAGSAALIESPAPIRPVSVIQSLRAKTDLESHMIRPGTRGYPRIEAARGAYRNKMSSYQAHDANALWFSGSGDMHLVKQLMQDMPAIGTKRNIGYGTVSKIHVAQTGAAHAGFSHSDGSPARPIPAEIWKAMGGVDCEMALETYCPPYWKGDRALCALPTHQVVSGKQAKDLLAL